MSKSLNRYHKSLLLALAFFLLVAVGTEEELGVRSALCVRLTLIPVSEVASMSDQQVAARLLDSYLSSLQPSSFCTTPDRWLSQYTVISLRSTVKDYWQAAVYMYPSLPPDLTSYGPVSPTTLNINLAITKNEAFVSATFSFGIG